MLRLLQDQPQANGLRPICGDGEPTASTPPPRLGPNGRFLLATCAVVGILALGWCIFSLWPTPTGSPLDAWKPGEIFGGPHQLNRFLVQVITEPDCTRQVVAHKVMLVAITVFGLGAFLWPARWRPRSSLWVIVAILPVAAGVGVYLYYGWQQRAPWISYAVGAVLVGVCYFLGSVAAKPIWNRILGGVAVLLFLAAFLPAAFGRCDLSAHPWDAIERYEMHHVLLLSQGDRLAAGAPLFEDVVPYYGVGLTVVTATAQRAGVPLSIHKYHLLLQATQALYVLGFLIGYYYYGRKRWLPVLPPLFFLVGLYHFNHQLLLYPNHLAWRYLGFSLALLSLVVVRQWPSRRAVFGLGATAGVCNLLNPETGVVVTLALTAYVLYRYGGEGQGYRLLHWARLGMRFTAGALLSLLAFTIFYRVGLGQWPDLLGIGRLYTTLLMMTRTGYSGQRFHFTVMPVLIFAHAALVVVRAWAERPARPTGHQGVRLVVATMILVWFAYYANRSQPEYLYTYVVLYGFLVVDALRALTVARRRRLAVVPLLAGAAAVCLVVVPYCGSLLAKEYDGYRDGLKSLATKPDPKTATRLSGVYLPNDRRTGALIDKAEHLRFLSLRGPVAYCTVDSYLIPKVSHVWPGLPFADSFWECVTRKNYEKLLARLRSGSVETVLLDAEESIADCPPPEGVQLRKELSWPPFSLAAREFYRSFRVDLARDYERIGVEHGWEVWRRRNLSPVP